MADFDALRLANPLLGFALYAYEPGKGVILEILTPIGETLTFRGASFAETLALAFPRPAPPIVSPPTIFD